MIGQLTDHLLQSTLFALTAALLVLAFRRNRARVRYALWLAASLKFLIPFSMLIALGSQIHWTPAAHAIASPETVQTVEQFSEPFTVAIPTQPQQTDRTPLAIAALWFAGFACVVILRLRAWRGMRIAIHRSQPLDLGLLVEVRLSSGVFEPGVVGLWRPILLLPQGIIEHLTPSELEAVIAHELCHIRRRDNLFAAVHMLLEALFWFHPLVWWIGARLLDERERACDEYVISQGNQPDIYADAILNVCKLYTESPLACVSGVTGADIRRRIEAIMSNQKAAGLNLAKKTILACAAVATLATPLTIGLLIGIGHAPHLLAESRSAATTPAHPDEPKPALPSIPPAALPVPKLPILIAQTPPTPPPPATANARAQRCTVVSPEAAKMKFDALSVKPVGIRGRGNAQINGGPGSNDPGHVTMPRMPLPFLILISYDLWSDQVQGPPWLSNESYDLFAIDATMPQTTTKEQYCGMLRNLLADRFHLTFHHEMQPRPGYELIVLPGGPKFQPYVPGQSAATGPTAGTDANGFVVMPPDRATAGGQLTSPSGLRKQSMRNNLAQFARFVGAAISPNRGGASSEPIPRVVDKTGLSGTWDIRLEYQLDPLLPNSPTPPDGVPQVPTPEWGPTIFDALQQQLGLKLQKVKDVPIDVLVVDHIDQMPTEN